MLQESEFKSKGSVLLLRPAIEGAAKGLPAKTKVAKGAKGIPDPPASAAEEQPPSGGEALSGAEPDGEATTDGETEDDSDGEDADEADLPAERADAAANMEGAPQVEKKQDSDGSVVGGLATSLAIWLAHCKFQAKVYEPWDDRDLAERDRHGREGQELGTIWADALDRHTGVLWLSHPASCAPL